MPFDAPPNRLAPLPQLNPEVVQPNYYVSRIGDIVNAGLANVDKIIQEFSPLSKAEKAAKIAQYAYIRAAYEAGQNGDSKMLEALVGHAGKDTPQEIYDNAFMKEKGARAAGKGSPIAQPDESGPVRAARIQAAKQQIPQGNGDANSTLAQPAGSADSLTSSLGNTSLSNSDYPPVAPPPSP